MNLVLLVGLQGCRPRGFNLSKVRDSNPQAGHIFLNCKFEELSDDSEEWKRLSVHEPSQPIAVAFKWYLPNLYRSVKLGFIPWFEKKSDTADLPFAEMLRIQHTLLRNGEKGTYNGATLLMHNLGTSEVPPGRYRYKIYDKEPDRRLVMAFQTDRKLKGGLSTQIKKLREFYFSQSSEKKGLEPYISGPDELKMMRCAT